MSQLRANPFSPQVELHSLMALLGLLWRTPSVVLKIICIVWIIVNIVSPDII